MRKLSRYVGRTVLAATVVVLLSFIGLDVIFRVIEEAGKMEGNYTFAVVVGHELLKTPARLYELMPMVGLIGCLAGLGSMANTSELVVMRAAGASTFRLVWIALRPALLMLLIAMLVGEYVAPHTQQMAHVYRAKARDYDAAFQGDRGVWIRDDRDFVLVNVVQSSGVMYGINLFRFDRNNRLEHLLQAERATFTGDQWLMEEVEKTDFILQPDSEQIKKTGLSRYHWQSTLEPELLSIAVAEPADLQLTQLHDYIDYLKSQSLNSSIYQLAFWEKVFYPLMMISLVLVGISFVFGPLRQVSMGYRIFWGILIGIGFQTLQDTLAPVSMVFGFPAVLAMSVPVLLSMLIGAIMLARVR